MPQEISIEHFEEGLFSWWKFVLQFFSMVIKGSFSEMNSLRNITRQNMKYNTKELSWKGSINSISSEFSNVYTSLTRCHCIL